jgi:hypothetical protein
MHSAVYIFIYLFTYLFITYGQTDMLRLIGVLLQLLLAVVVIVYSTTLFR